MQCRMGHKPSGTSEQIAAAPGPAALMINQLTLSAPA